MGFEPTISAGERPQTYALDRAATGTGRKKIVLTYLFQVKGQVQGTGSFELLLCYGVHNE